MELLETALLVRARPKVAAPMLPQQLITDFLCKSGSVLIATHQRGERLLTSGTITDTGSGQSPWLETRPPRGWEDLGAMGSGCYGGAEFDRPRHPGESQELGREHKRRIDPEMGRYQGRHLLGRRRKQGVGHSG